MAKGSVIHQINIKVDQKDLALIESFKKDGFSIPKEIKLKEIAERYNVPDNLLSLAKTKESGLLALKFVEISSG